MTSREKFISVFNDDSGAAIPKTEFAYWAGTMRRWISQGMMGKMEVPASVLDGDIVRAAVSFGAGSELESMLKPDLVDTAAGPRLGLDSYLVKFPLDFSPRLEKHTVEETPSYRTFRDQYGALVKQVKANASTHHVIEYPVRTRADFGAFRERYDKQYELRLPAPPSVLKNALKNRAYPIRLGGNPFGFTFFPRFLMGEEGYMIALFEEPNLVHDINRFYLDMVKEYWSLILGSVEVECVFILEDVAYKNGPMISPAMFREFALPYTRELVDFVRQFGVKNIVVDCDGRIDELIPLWAEAGVTGLFPIEAVNDILAIRGEYPKLLLLGGVDKRPLIAGNRKAVDDELARIGSLFQFGNYIPHIDHAVSEDITWDMFVYYRGKLNGIIDRMVKT